MWQFSTLTGLLVVSCLAAPQNAPTKDDSVVNAMIDIVYGPFYTTGSPPEAPQAETFGDSLNVDDTEKDCKCVPYYQCEPNGTIITHGAVLIDIRARGSCSNYLEFCCHHPNLELHDQRNKTPPLPPGICGRRNAQGVGFRIVGAEHHEAQFGEFPWMVAILNKNKVNTNNRLRAHGVYQPGGALIHPQAILTAAHNVVGKRPSQLKVRAGEWDTQTETEILPHQERDVAQIIIHEKFNSGTLFNDFAILILNSPFELAENVDVICLPELNERFDAERCLVTGWGKDVFGRSGRYQRILKRVELPVVPNDSCQTSLRRTRLGEYFILDPSFVCAGGEAGFDACNGDGGSPLICPLKNDPDRYVQAGIVAWGIGCGNATIPGVYANVAGARAWIDEKMAAKNLNTSSYTY